MRRLEGRIALITGAGRGIGQGIARCLAEEGADIVLNDLPVPAGMGAPSAETAHMIEALGRQVFPYYADVADPQQVTAMFEAAIHHFGRLDIVVANAAMSIREPVIEAEWEHARRTIEVTQFGVWHTCQAAARHMVARGGGGKIVIIASVLAELPMVTSAAYNMAKAAVTHFGRTLAAELTQHRVNVNIVQPGWIDTPGERAFASEEQIREGAQLVPWGRLGTPRDIGRAVAFLAGDDADYVTGSVLVVDGGYRLGLRLPGLTT